MRWWRHWSWYWSPWPKAAIIDEDDKIVKMYSKCEGVWAECQRCNGDWLDTRHTGPSFTSLQALKEYLVVEKIKR